MWNRMLAEALVIAVQTVILIGLCATIGVSGSGRKTQAESVESARTEPQAQDKGVLGRLKRTRTDIDADVRSCRLPGVRNRVSLSFRFGRPRVPAGAKLLTPYWQ